MLVIQKMSLSFDSRCFFLKVWSPHCHQFWLQTLQMAFKLVSSLLPPCPLFRMSHGRPVTFGVSGAGTNLKIWARHTSVTKRRHFFVMPFYFFGSKIQLVVLMSAFVVVSTVWSVSCFRPGSDLYSVGLGFKLYSLTQFLVCCSSTDGAPFPSHL